MYKTLTNQLLLQFNVHICRFMKDRKPYEIKNILLVYNFCQTLFSLWMFGEGWSFYISGNYRSTLHWPLLAINIPK